jgi:hypothetical protein
VSAETILAVREGYRPSVREGYRELIAGNRLLFAMTGTDEFRLRAEHAERQLAALEWCGDASLEGASCGR